MAGYTRTDTTNNIATGNVINASDLDNEYDAIQAAYNATTGHTHGGAAGEGAPITRVGPVQDVVVSGSAVTPKTDNTMDLGSSSLEFKDLYIDGTANIDSLVADTADINGGTVDGAVIGGASAAAGTFTTATATTGNITTVNATTVDTTNIEVTNIKAKDGTAAATIADATGVMTVASAVLTTADINGGTVDGAVIGGATPAAATFTTATATTGNITTVNATTVNTTNLDLTNLEVTNIKAKDGTASATIADSTGVMTVASAVLTTADINGGTIDGAVIGGSTAAAGNFTTLGASSTATLNTLVSSGATITGGSVNNVPIGASTANTGAFTTLSASSTATLNTLVSSGATLTGGSINGMAIGATTASTGAFSTLSATGVATFSAGTVSAPAITTTGDTNTGIFFPAADTIAFTEGGVESMRIDSSGNVGIGTTSPTANTRLTLEDTQTVKLVLRGGSNQNGMLFNAVSSSNQYYVGAGNNLLVGNDRGFLIYDVTNNRAKFYAEDVNGETRTVATSYLTYHTNANERMRIDSGGNVGIGTSSPATKLQVDGGSIRNVNSNGILEMANGNTAGGTKLSSYNAALTANGYLAFEGYSIEYGRFDSSGNLLVGRTSTVSIGGASPIIYAQGGVVTTDGTNTVNLTPDRIVFNASNFYVLNSSGSTGVVLPSGNTAWSSQSDERLKTDLKPLENAITKVNSLRTFTGRYKKDDANKSRVFLIAQDVQAVLPEAVSELDDEQKTLVLAYTDVVPLLVAAIKEQQVMIENLTTRLNALEGK